MSPRNTSDFETDTTEINPVILGVLEEYVGRYKYHRIRDGTDIDIALEVDQDTVLLRLDDPKSYLVGFVKGLEPGEKIGIIRLDEPSKYFIRRIIKNKNPCFPPS